jgi:hypothetical protein
MRLPVLLMRRAALIASLALALLLVFLWPVARSVGEALADYGDLIAHGLLAFGAVLLLALARIALAYGRRLEVEADQAGLTQLPNGQPIHIADVRELPQPFVERGITLYYQAEQARAERSQFSNLHSIHQVLRIDQPAPVPPALVEPPPAVIEPPPGLEEAIRRDLTSPERWFVGVDDAGQPQQIVLRHAGFLAISGVQGTGKTNLAALIAGQCAAYGGAPFVADPHLGDEESLAARIAPFSGAVERFATTPEEINMLIAKVDKIYQARTRDVRQINGPVLLIIDEFMDLMLRGHLADASIAALLALSGVGRKKHIFVTLISQNWSQRLLGPQGVAIRQNVTHALVCRSSQETARFLLPPSFAQQAMLLSPGQLLYFGGNEPTVTTAPLLSDADLRLAARGRPPRPYTPWSLVSTPQLSDTASAPTSPIPSAPPRPAPPTERLPLPTVPEQIIDLLRAQSSWMTSTEIAAALGVDVQVVRTELTPLYRRAVIQRRATSRSTTERYEYASQPINQSTSQRLIPSA